MKGKWSLQDCYEVNHTKLLMDIKDKIPTTPSYSQMERFQYRKKDHFFQNSFLVQCNPSKNSKDFSQNLAA